MSHDSCKAALASDWLAFLSSMARTKKMPRMGEGRKVLQFRTRAEVHAEWEPQAPEDPPVPEVEASPTLSKMENRIAEAEKFGEVARVIANLTIGPDGYRGQAIYVRWGEAGTKEA